MWMSIIYLVLGIQLEGIYRKNGNDIDIRNTMERFEDSTYPSPVFLVKYFQRMVAWSYGCMLLIFVVISSASS